MELVIVKNRGRVKVYQGKIIHEGNDYYFFMTTKDGEVKDIVVHTLSEDEFSIIPVNKKTMDDITSILVNEYISEQEQLCI